MMSCRRSLLCAALGLGLAAACRTQAPEPVSEPARAPTTPTPHYLDSGGDDQRALVLVHGWASSTEAWRLQFPDLQSVGRVIAVDLPGHGLSAAPADGYSIAGFADSIAAVMDDAGVRDAVLVGHSNGVPVIASFYHRHPERTAGLVGIDGALKPMFDREMFDGFFGPFRGPEWRAAMGAMIDGMPGPGLADEDRAAIRAMALATGHAAVVGGAEAALADDAFSDAPIDAPLLLVLARQPAWSEAYEAWVRERAPGVDYRVWDGVGHYIQFERPAELRAALVEFIDAHDLLPPQR